MISPPPGIPSMPSLKTPSSMIPNSFPRKYIASTESILFETKPYFYGYFFSGKGIAYLIFIAILAIISLGLVAFFFMYSPQALPYLIITISILLFLFVILPILIMALIYKYTYYAITNSRVLVAHGILNKNLISINYDMITSIEVIQPWLMTRMVKMGFIKFNVPSIVRGFVFWSFIKQPDETYRFLLDVKNIYDTMGSIATTYFQANVYGNVIAANVGSKKKCINCGRYINNTAKFCPYCGYRQP